MVVSLTPVAFGSVDVPDCFGPRASIDARGFQSLDGSDLLTLAGYSCILPNTRWLQGCGAYCN